MITEKTKKTNSKTTSPTAVKSQGKSIVNLVFSLMGFVLGMGSLMALFIMPMVANADNGTYINEPFTCEVALANYHHLTKTTKENNPKFVQEQLVVSLEAITQELAEHLECKGVSDGK